MRIERGIVLALAALVIAAIALPAPAKAQDARRIEVEILGMSCPFCAYGVEQKLKRLDGVENLEVELKTGVATLSVSEGLDISNEALERVISEAGFKVAAISRSFESEYPDFEP